MIRVFKSSSNEVGVAALDKRAIRLNHSSGRQTNILFDTNIMITIEGAYPSGRRHQELKDAGIFDLSELIRKNAKFGVFISPAAAYQELPPSRRRDVEAAFERFTRDYLPTFRDDPNSTKVRFGDGSEDPEPFKSLPEERQKLVACSYASLLAMNVISQIKGLNNLDRFILYFDYCTEVLDLVSLKDLTIARYVYAPELGITDELRQQKVAVTKNFLRLKKGGSKGLTPSEVLKRIALNGSNDLKLISTADMVSNLEERVGLQIVRHDVWIATSDEKLYEFCCACPGFAGPESRGALARFMDTQENITGTSYWRNSMDVQVRRLGERFPKLARVMELEPVVNAALDLEAKVDSDEAIEYFTLRSWR